MDVFEAAFNFGADEFLGGEGEGGGDVDSGGF